MFRREIPRGRICGLFPEQLHFYSEREAQDVFHAEAAAEAAKAAGFDPSAAGGAQGGADGVVNDDNMTPPEGGWED